MAKLWAVVKREYLERVRTRWFLIATIFGPVLLAALTILPALLSSRSRASADVANIVILDATGTNLGERVAARLGGGLTMDRPPTRVRAVELARLADAESTATREVMAKRARGYLVLDNFTVGGIAARYAGRNASSLLDVNRIESAVRQSVMALRLERAGIEPAQVRALSDMRLRLNAEQITDAGRGGSGTVGFFFAFGVAFLLYTSIMIYCQNVLRGVMEEKATRVAEVVISSVRPQALLAGKVIGVGAVGLTQQLIWIVTSVAMLKARAPLFAALHREAAPLQLPAVTPGVGALLVLFFLLGYTFYAALYAAVGAMVNSEQEAQQAAMPVVLLIVSSVIFMQPVLLNPTSTLAQVMSILPFSAPLIMPLRMAMVPVPPREIALAIAGVLVACVAAVWLASRIYRVGLLMYGKRPTVAELVRWVRYAD